MATLTEQAMNGKPVYAVPAKSVLNMKSGFKHKLLCDGPTFTAGTACSFSCTFCLAPDTLIQMADGTTKQLIDVHVGDELIGVVKRPERRIAYNYSYAVSRVLAKAWTDNRSAYRVGLADGQSVVCSADHRWLTERGWKYTNKLTRNNQIRTFNLPIETPPVTDEYRRGYLAGIIRGDGMLRRYNYSGRYQRRGAKAPQRIDVQHQFRLAMRDPEAIARAAEYLSKYGVVVQWFAFKQKNDKRPTIPAIRTSSRASFEAIKEIIVPMDSYEWQRGWLAGIFDAEGSWTSAVRVHNKSEAILTTTEGSFGELGFSVTRDPRQRNGCGAVRLLGGLAANVRLFNLTNPVISRKFNVAGAKLRNAAPNKVVSVELLHDTMKMLDITTTTENFIANGLISHNCYVEDLMRKSPHTEGIDRPFEDVVIRREGVIDALRQQLTFAKGKPRYLDPSDQRVLYMSPLVDVAGNTVLRDETIEACKLILTLTHWQIRILSKSNMLQSIAAALAPWNSRERMIFGVSTGTLDDELAKSFERGTALVSRRIQSLHWLQDHGYRTFGMICPSLPQADRYGYLAFAQSMYMAIRADKCEHVWAEVMNVRGESMVKTTDALRHGGFHEEARLLESVSEDSAAWEEYSRATFEAHAPLYREGQLRFLQYVTRDNKDWWTARVERGAVLL